MVEQHGRVKRFLPAVLRDLHFQVAPAGEHHVVRHSLSDRTERLEKRILTMRLNIILRPLKRLVADAEGRIQRAGYSLCLLERLQDAYVEGTSGSKTAIAGESPREAVAKEW